ncbi:hypothetical protein [Pygmaiobacter massiliensis]|uniref:hypothetical protein n=1 Tax=Pygmaiobacter massiliensis TaxID=1917873 RepID=UPI00289799E4|nr:hypothetical protein [Pygmaiobacter massiliensis]
MDFRVLLPNERSYTYSQSQQLSMQTGCIGHLRTDMDSNGEGFFSSWDDFRKDLKTQEFKDEFDTVINELRKDGNILCNRSTLSKYCFSTPESSFGNDREYGVRVDTEQYAYLMRLNPYKGEYNLYCYCYRKDWLDSHLEKAEKGIRFITPHYKEIFRIPDGNQVRITTADGQKLDRTCRYIDDCHVKVGRNLYHICEFAERMEQAGNTVVPLRSSLPEQCYSSLLDTGMVVILKRGETGYYKTDIPFTDKESAKALVREYNDKLGVSKAQEAAMQTGSMFGFQVPGADPKGYDENGMPIKTKQKDRGDAR